MPDRVTLSFTDVAESDGSTTSTVTATLANSDSTKDQDIVFAHDVVVTLTERSGGTATGGGTDYAALGTLPTVTISAGDLEGTASLSITPTDDHIDEGDGETVRFGGTVCKTAAASCPADQQIAGLTVSEGDLAIADNDDPSLLSTLPASSPASTTSYNAQGFTTGAKRSLVTVVSIGLAGSKAEASATIRKDTTSGCPTGISSCPDFGLDGLVATLLNPDDLTGDGVFSFTAPEGTYLDPRTSYWLLIHEGVSTATKREITTTESAATSSVGWTMGDRLHRTTDRTDSDGWAKGGAGRRLAMQITGFSPAPSTQVTLSVAPTSISEEGGEQEVTVTATLDGAVRTTGTTVTVTFSSDGTADHGPGNDYEVLPAGTGTNTIASDTITIPAGSEAASKTYRFRPVDDSLDEGASETIVITGALDSASAADLTAGVEQASITLTDEDRVLISNIASSSSDFRAQRGAHRFTTGSDAAHISAVKIKFQSGGTASTVRIRRDAAGQPDMTASGLVATLTSPGTAEAGNVVSFAAPPGTVLEAGTTYWVTIHEGATGQPALWATAASPAVDALAGWSMDAGVLRFSDDSNTWSRYNKDLLFELRGAALPSVTLAVLDSSGNAVTSISEANAAATSIKIKATVDEAAAADITITLSRRGTATGSGTDYTAAFPTTVTIPSGSTSFETGTFSITAVDDSVSEGDETVVVGGSATGYGVSSATIGLVDNDLIDYDTDDDGLIEVATAAQLNAIRWDADGDGTVEDVIVNNSRVEDTAHTMDYAAAFPAPASGMGCPIGGLHRLRADRRHRPRRGPLQHRQGLAADSLIRRHPQRQRQQDHRAVHARQHCLRPGGRSGRTRQNRRPRHRGRRCLRRLRRRAGGRHRGRRHHHHPGVGHGRRGRPRAQLRHLRSRRWRVGGASGGIPHAQLVGRRHLGQTLRPRRRPGRRGAGHRFGERLARHRLDHAGRQRRRQGRGAGRHECGQHHRQLLRRGGLGQRHGGHRRRRARRRDQRGGRRHGQLLGHRRQRAVVERSRHGKDHQRASDADRRNRHLQRLEHRQLGLRHHQPVSGAEGDRRQLQASAARAAGDHAERGGQRRQRRHQHQRGRHHRQVGQDQGRGRRGGLGRHPGDADGRRHCHRQRHRLHRHVPRLGHHLVERHHRGDRRVQHRHRWTTPTPEGTETIIVSGQVGDGSKFNVTPATVDLDDNDQPVITVALSVSVGH